MTADIKNERFGLETIYEAFKTSIKKKSDVIILLVHWYLTCKKHFLFIGIGEPLEPLPDNLILNERWNESSSNYLMHYTIRDLKYTLASSSTDDSLIMNLINFEKYLISQMIIEVKYAVKSLETSKKIISNIENLETVIQRIAVELVNPVYEIPQKNRSTQTQKAELIRLEDLRKKKRVRSAPSVCKDILHILTKECCVPHPNAEDNFIFKSCKAEPLSVNIPKPKRQKSPTITQDKLNHFHFLMYS